MSYALRRAVAGEFAKQVKRTRLLFVSCQIVESYFIVDSACCLLSKARISHQLYTTSLSCYRKFLFWVLRVVLLAGSTAFDALFSSILFLADIAPTVCSTGLGLFFFSLDGFASDDVADFFSF